MHIGILGGSFDPVHNGHIYMAQKALEECSLDEVWLIPAGHSPNKAENAMTPADMRLAMCKLACRDNERIKVCSLEVNSDEISYTYRTLQKLHAAHPDDTFYFIMGADSLAYFINWVHPEIISSLAILLVVNRGNYSINDLTAMADEINGLFPADIRFLECPKYNISSRYIRKALCDGFDMQEQLPPEVLAYIRQKELYHIKKYHEKQI